MTAENNEFHHRTMINAETARHSALKIADHLEYGNYKTNMEFGIEALGVKEGTVISLNQEEKQEIDAILVNFQHLFLECLRYSQEQGFDYLSQLTQVLKNQRTLVRDTIEQIDSMAR